MEHTLTLTNSRSYSNLIWLGRKVYPTAGFQQADVRPLVPAPEPEPAPAPGAEVPGDAPEAAEPGAHGPSFAPHVDDGEPPAQAENTEPDQGVDDGDRAAPIPHVDGEPGSGDEAGGDTADGEQTSPPYSDPDPVSSTTQAAILDAQGALDEDDENPSGG